MAEAELLSALGGTSKAELKSQALQLEPRWLEQGNVLMGLLPDEPARLVGLALKLLTQSSSTRADSRSIASVADDDDKKKGGKKKKGAGELAAAANELSEVRAELEESVAALQAAKLRETDRDRELKALKGRLDE